MSLKKAIQTSKYGFLPRRYVPITDDELDFLSELAVEHKQRSIPIRFNHHLHVRRLLDDGKASWGCRPVVDDVSSIIMADDLRDRYLELTGQLKEIQFNYMGPNDSISPHIDLSGEVSLGCVLGLTNDYRGGHFHFTYGPMIRIGRGDLLMINPTRQHWVDRVTLGEKITLAYWLS